MVSWQLILVTPYSFLSKWKANQVLHWTISSVVHIFICHGHYLLFEISPSPLLIPVYSHQYEQQWKLLHKGVAGCHCAVTLSWFDLYNRGEWNKYVINNKLIFFLGFTFFLQCLTKVFYLPCWFILALFYSYLFHGKLNVICSFICFLLYPQLRFLWSLSLNISCRPWAELQWSLQRFLRVFPVNCLSNR